MKNISMTPDIIESFFDLDVEMSYSTGEGRKHIDHFKIDSKDYLKFSKLDFESNLGHKNINYLSNIKRAIHCQTDTLLKLFGLDKLAVNDKWNFPDKIEILSQMKIVPPLLLKKINKNRNLVEHEYVYPESNEIEEPYEIADLFIGKTILIIRSWPEDISFKASRDLTICWLGITFNYESRKMICEYSEDEFDRLSGDFETITMVSAKGSYNFDTHEYLKILTIFGKKDVFEKFI